MAQTVKRHTVTDTGAQTLTALIDATVAALLAEGERVVDIEFSDRAFEPCVDGECLVRLIEVTSRTSLNELVDYRTEVVHPNDLDLAGQTFEQYVQAILDAWTGDGVTFQCGAFSDTGFDFEGIPAGGEGARCYVMIGYNPVECPESEFPLMPKALYFTNAQGGMDPGSIEVEVSQDPNDTRADVVEPNYAIIHRQLFDNDGQWPSSDDMLIHGVVDLVAIGPPGGPWAIALGGLQSGKWYLLGVTAVYDDGTIQELSMRQDSRLVQAT